MKLFLLIACFATSVFANDPNTYLKNFESKIYSLKTKGVKDFVVDIESSKLTKQINDQQIYGKVESLVFRTYWTQNPERLAIEVVGLPEGFREVKEELKATILTVMDNLLPLSFAQRFPGYKFVPGSSPKEIIAQDSTKVALVPSYVLKFDAQDKLIEVIGNKPIGTFTIKTDYEKESFADGKWVLNEQKTISSESGQVVTVEKDLDYGKTEGIPVLEEVAITTEQKVGDNRAMKVSETITFKNYKINAGEGMKYFLGEQKVDAAKKPAP